MSPEQALGKDTGCCGPTCSRSGWCFTRWRRECCPSGATTSAAIFNAHPPQGAHIARPAESGRARRAGTDHQQVPGEGPGPALPASPRTARGPEALQRDTTSGAASAARPASALLAATTAAPPGPGSRPGALTTAALGSLAGVEPLVSNLRPGPSKITPFTTRRRPEGSCPRSPPTARRSPTAGRAPRDDSPNIYLKARGFRHAGHPPDRPPGAPVEPRSGPPTGGRSPSCARATTAPKSTPCPRSADRRRS